MEVNSETDFVARNEHFQGLVLLLWLHLRIAHGIGVARTCDGTLYFTINLLAGPE